MRAFRRLRGWTGHGPLGTIMAAGPLASQRGAAEQATALLELASQACRAHRRPDLAERLAAAQRRLVGPLAHLVVVGEFKQGKSSLVNALVGAAVCPVDDDIATAVPTYVRDGPVLRADLLVDGEPPRREPIGIDQVRGFVVEGGQGRVGTADPQQRVVGVEIQVPHELLADGLVIVDTPGVGGLASAHGAASLAALALADAVLFVTDAAQELTRSELDFLHRARSACDTVACVLTKTDFFPGWRMVRDLDAEHLRKPADIPLIAVSSVLRRHATTVADTPVDAESGFAELVRFVTEQVTGSATSRAAGKAAAEVEAACDQLIRQLAAERTALRDPATADQVLSDLAAATQRIAALATPAARWHRALVDGVAGLAAELDQDLGNRIRCVVGEADETLCDVDPVEAWPQLPPWLQSRVSRELLENHALLRQRADALIGEVAQHFRAEATDFLDPAFSQLLGGVAAGGSAVAALRSASDGGPIFTTLGSVAGIVLGPLSAGIVLGPLSAGNSLVMGRDGPHDEKLRQLDQRRAQAKNAIRRYCDEARVVIGRNSGETLRRLQHQWGEQYRTIAAELHRCTAQAHTAARQAVQLTGAQQVTRLAELDVGLARLGELRQRAVAVTR